MPIVRKLEKAAKELGLKVHATNADIKVATHPLAAPRIGIVHNWQNTQNDGWFRVAFEELESALLPTLPIPGCAKHKIFARNLM